MIRIRRACALAFACFVLWTGAAPAQPLARLPDGTLAVPPLARVTDTTGTLNGAQRKTLEDRLAAFEDAHGSQVAIVIVPSTQPEPIADFAQRIGDRWKIGRAGIGDGLLVVVAKEDRQIWIATSKALEGSIPDLAAKRVIREEIAPRFRQGDFVGGLSAGLDRLFKLIEGEGFPAPVGVSRDRVQAGESMLALLLPFVMIGAIVAATARRLLGVPGALVASGGAGAVTGLLLASIAFGAIAAFAIFAISLASGGGGGGRVLGGRRGGLIVPGGWSSRGGHWGGGGRSSGGWSSGGGGNFGGGGAGGSW